MSIATSEIAPQSAVEVRSEHDLLGYLDVPAQSYYGVHTARAVENFPISGIQLAIYPLFIGALATVKQAAATANREPRHRCPRPGQGGDGLLHIWSVMRECVDQGCRATGVLPGGLKVRRRAHTLHQQLLAADGTGDPLHAMEWITLYALAVNEENAAGGRVVTAPTNGAAGIVPAVLHYYRRFVPGADDDGVVRFLLAAAAIGILFKEGASISGAEVGCQGEVGSACAMAAGGLAEVLGGTAEHVENAAEIGIEHNLGLTCDPVGGLVQIPCIERNAVASVKAITAARMAILGDGQHHVSLDKAIRTMRETGADMSVKYKETARGGLALHVIPVNIPVNIVEC
jgi:L-serine dehydratase